MSTPKIKVLEVEVHNMQWDELRRHRGAKKARMYFFCKGENLIENLLGRHFRPKVLFRQVFDEVFTKAGIEKPVRITWSQYAGCRCPCSPGFILNGIYNKNIYVTYEGEKVIEEVKVAFEQAVTQKTETAQQSPATA